VLIADFADGDGTFNSATTYYVIVVNATTVKLAASEADALSNTPIGFGVNYNNIVLLPTS
jgi:hypothetical protein